MSIFTRIKDAIFGHDDAARTSSTSSPSSGTRTATPSTKAAAPASSPPKPPPAAGAPQAAPKAVDIEAVLTQLASRSAQKLNWRTSIVDLMKLVGIESSLENRKELARELGYQGDTADSAAMNIWLHKRVMQELAANGGKVPKELTD